MIRELPNLRFQCSRCGVVISHESDPALVRSVAARHCDVMHRQLTEAGDMSIFWEGFADDETVDAVLRACCPDGKGITDLWADERGVHYESEGYNGHDPTEALLDRIATVVGPSLTVLDRRHRRWSA